MARVCTACGSSPTVDSPGVLSCPYCGGELAEAPGPEGVSSQPTLEPLDPVSLHDEEERYRAADLLLDLLEDQHWGTDGLDPFDEECMRAVLPMLDPLEEDAVEEALEALDESVPAEAAEAFFDAFEASAVPASPRVQLGVDAPDGAAVFTLTVEVQDIRAKWAHVDLSAPGLSVESTGRRRRGSDHRRGSARLRRERATLGFSAHGRAGARRVQGRVEVALSGGWAVPRIYRAPFLFEVAGSRPIVSSYEIHNSGIMRWNQESSAAAAGSPRQAGRPAAAGEDAVSIENDGGLVRANTARRRGGLKVKNRGGGVVRLSESGPEPAAAGSSEALPPGQLQPLVVVPDLVASHRACVEARLELSTDSTASDEPRIGAADPAHNGLLAWRNARGTWEAAFLQGEESVFLGRHHRQADIPVRCAEDPTLAGISRRSLQLAWARGRAWLKRVGSSPVHLDGCELERDQRTLLPSEPTEVTFLRSPDVTWTLESLDGVEGGLRPVRWCEPSSPRAGRVWHVVAPSGGLLGGAGSLVPLPRRRGAEPAVPLRRDLEGGWWIGGLEGGGLQLDGRPCLHPELGYGLRDGARILLPTGTELRFFVARSSPGGEWELEALLGSELKDLRGLLEHVIVP